jgi:CheY-like chemotaxis protein
MQGPPAADHHVYGEKRVKTGEDAEYIKWSKILERIGNAARVSLVIDLSATPWYGSGSPKPEGTLFEWLASDFSVYDAFESGLVKVVRLPNPDGPGFMVDSVGTIEEARAALRASRYTGTVLDLGLPDGDGIALLTDIGSVPTLICSGRDSQEERISGLNAGADGYLTKPFSLAELEAHLRAILRRPALRRPTAFVAKLSCGTLSYNPYCREVTARDCLLKHDTEGLLCWRFSSWQPESSLPLTHFAVDLAPQSQ